ncbi:MAG: DoxX family protein [Acidobacteriaceae bacterium]
MKQSSGSTFGGSDMGLLLLRLFLGTNLFLWHGLEKINHFSQMSVRFPDPIHIGSHWSFIFAFTSDAVCSVLVFLGLGTRVAAFIVFVDISVAFSLVHHFPFQSGHGEVLLLYIGGFLALILTGAGRYSLDGKFWGRS